MTELRNKLLAAYARLEGHKRNLEQAENELHDRAVLQHDTAIPVAKTVAEYVEQDKGGGVLGLRRLRSLQVEQYRLRDILARRMRND
jgi:hypothetical protein